MTPANWFDIKLLPYNMKHPGGIEAAMVEMLSDERDDTCDNVLFEIVDMAVAKLRYEFWMYIDHLARKEAK